MKQTILKRKDILVDKTICTRDRLDNKVVMEYVTAMNQGDIFPPLYIALYKKKYILVDGRYRLEAYSINGDEHVQCEIKKNFPNMEAIFLASVRANLKHGLRYNYESKKIIAVKLRDMGITFEEVSKLTGIGIRQLETSFSKKIKHVLMKDSIKKGRFPKIIKEEIFKKETPKIDVVEDTNYDNTDDIEKSLLYELNNIYEFFRDNKFDLDNRKMSNLIRKIKKKLHKKFPKL